MHSILFIPLFVCSDFDRAIPVINHKEVDLLMLQLDQHAAMYVHAEASLALKVKGGGACCRLPGLSRLRMEAAAGSHTAVAVHVLR